MAKHLKIDTLKIRKEIKHLMIDVDLDRPGSYDILLPHLRKKIPTLSKNKINMAMTGFMDGQSYQRALVEMKRVLKTMEKSLRNGEANPRQSGPRLTECSYGGDDRRAGPRSNANEPWPTSESVGAVMTGGEG